jgi:4'-phosphopantetheinyl transferase
MSRINPIAYTAESQDSFFRESDWLFLPELDSSVLIVLRTEQFGTEELTRLGSFLSKEEIAKSRRFRFYQDRTSYIVVHGLLRWILGRHLGIPPKSVEFTYGLSGKPSITGYSSKMFFNLSHSSGVSVLAFDPEHEIGADVEKIAEDFEYEPIIDMFFTRKERQYIQILKELSRRRFYELWTRKEAFLKATGTGITKDLSVEVLEEKINGNALMGNPDARMEFLFKSMMYDKKFMITIAMNSDHGKICVFVPGNDTNKLVIHEA